MTKNFGKFFLNNLKESKYLGNIERVDFDCTKTDANNILGDKELRKRRDKIDGLQVYVRHNNLKIYMENMLRFRTEQFFTLVVPTALLVGTVASFVAPSKRVEKHDFSSTYVKEATVLSNTDGEIFDNSHVYYYDNNFFASNEYEFVKDNEGVYRNKADSLYYQMSDGIDSILARFTYDDDGKLYFNNVDVGKYIDVNNYDFSNATDVEERYENLFDDVLKLIKSEGDLSLEVEEELDKIASSEDKKIIINIIRYNNVGPGSTNIYEANMGRWFFPLLLTAYIWVIYMFIKNKKFSKRSELFVIDQGKLIYKPNEYIGFWHTALKYKEAFIRAEAERISNAYELASKYVKDEDVDSLFTEFEKSLIKKRKER